MKFHGIACAFSLLTGIWLQPLGNASITTPTSASKAEIVRLEGVLIDKDCSANAYTRVVGDHLEGGMFNAYIHEKQCLLKPANRKAGYGIFTYDQKYVPFDTAGNRKALALIRTTNKTDDLRVIVQGTPTGGHIKVSTIRLQ